MLIRIAVTNDKRAGWLLPSALYKDNYSLLFKFFQLKYMDFTY